MSLLGDNLFSCRRGRRQTYNEEADAVDLANDLDRLALEQCALDHGYEQAVWLECPVQFDHRTIMPILRDKLNLPDLSLILVNPFAFGDDFQIIGIREDKFGEIFK